MRRGSKGIQCIYRKSFVYQTVVSHLSNTHTNTGQPSRPKQQSHQTSGLASWYQTPQGKFDCMSISGRSHVRSHKIVNKINVLTRFSKYFQSRLHHLIISVSPYLGFISEGSSNSLPMHLTFVPCLKIHPLHLDTYQFETISLPNTTAQIDGQMDEWIDTCIYSSMLCQSNRHHTG